MGQRLKYLFLFVTGGLLYNLLEPGVDTWDDVCLRRDMFCLPGAN